MQNSPKMYKVIPKEVVVESATIAIEMGDLENSFSVLLAAAEKFEEAGCTPMFLLDGVKFDMFCVAKETFGKKLH
jgi:hypothetical protein